MVRRRLFGAVSNHKLWSSAAILRDAVEDDRFSG